MNAGDLLEIRTAVSSTSSGSNTIVRNFVVKAQQLKIGKNLLYPLSNTEIGENNFFATLGKVDNPFSELNSRRGLLKDKLTATSPLICTGYGEKFGDYTSPLVALATPTYDTIEAYFKNLI